MLKNAIVNKFRVNEAIVDTINADNIIEGRYRLFNSENKYDVIHFETNANQVIENSSKRFISDSERIKWNNKADINGNLNQDFNIKTLNISNSILPTTTNIDIGSSTQRFRSIYVDEAYLSTNTLYIGDTPILGTNEDNIIIKADPNQSITMQTTATGVTKIISEAGVELSTSGMNANVTIQSKGTNSQINLASTGATNFNAPNINFTGNTFLNGDLTTEHNVTIKGDLKVNGSNTILNTKSLTVKDNIIDINVGETGVGVSANKAGIKINRGDTDAYNILFDETDDLLKIGIDTNLKAVATRDWVIDNSTPLEHTHNVNQIIGLGTSATLDAGTSANQVLKLDSTGKIPINTLPSIAINETFFALDESEALSLTVQVGDIVILESNQNTYICVDSSKDSFDKKFRALTSTADSVTKIEVERLIANKVDKVSGKELSSNDFTNEYKNKLDGIAVNANNYIHPNDSNNRHVTDSQISTWNNKANSNHTHNNILSRGNISMEENTSRPTLDGLSMQEAFFNNYPTPYGNILNMKGSGDGQLLIGWSATSGANAPIYVRSRRNIADASWSEWVQLYSTAHKPSLTDLGITTLKRGSYLTGSNYNGTTTTTWAVDATTTPTENKIVARDASADINARLFKSNYQNQSNISGAIAFRTNNSDDNYIRFCSDTSAIRTFLSTYSKSESDNKFRQKDDLVFSNMISIITPAT